MAWFLLSTCSVEQLVPKTKALARDLPFSDLRFYLDQSQQVASIHTLEHDILSTYTVTTPRLHFVELWQDHRVGI